MQTLAIYGAGPALGRATAHRFGREGFRVALVARDRERLDGMVRELAGEGIEAAAFTADLADPAAALRAADAIEERFGAIDVLEHSPTPASSFLDPFDVEDAALAPLLDLYQRTPIALVRRLLPGMRERGRGGLLFAMGAAAKHPTPQLAGAGIALSGLRSYVHSLDAVLRGSGVRARTLLIGALIEGSAAHRNAAQWDLGDRPMTTVPSGELADLLWELSTTDDRVEEVVAPGAG